MPFHWKSSAGRNDGFMELRESYMPEKEIVHYIKNESNSDLVYIIAVACIERLVHLRKPGVIKAVIDTGTTTLLKMIK